MLNRREFLAATGASAVGVALASAPHFSNVAALPLAKPDISLRIGPASVEIAPGVVIKTTGYNGKIPGPILRAREGKRTTVEIHNDTDMPELVHWHGQFVASDVDGADEEGTPLVPAHGSRKFAIVPAPFGTRYYHTHMASKGELDRGTFNGQFGFFMWNPKASREITTRNFFLPRIIGGRPWRTWVRKTMAGKSPTSTERSTTKPWDAAIPYA